MRFSRRTLRAKAGKNRRHARRRLAALSEAANWWLVPRPSPSFIHRYTIQRDLYQRALDLSQRPWGSLWDWETKMGVRAVAELAGVPTPEVYLPPTHVKDIDFGSLPQEFVIKPVIGASKAGVFVLRRDGNAFRCLLRSNALITEGNVKLEIERLAADGVVSGDAIIAEQALLNHDRIVYDWKVYSFQGMTPLVMQIWREQDGRQSSYYDGQWRRLGSVRRGKESQDNLPLPSHPEELLQAASEVSRLLPVPFARIDLYEYDGTVYIGEISPMPGSGQRFKRNIDALLGRAWEEAESELLARNASNSASW